MKKNGRIAIILTAVIFLIIFIPLFALRGAEFGGSDSAGSDMAGEIAGEAHKPWFAPVIEKMIGGELSSELETLFFCIQTGIGVGVIAFCFGYLVARKKYSGDK